MSVARHIKHWRTRSRIAPPSDKDVPQLLAVVGLGGAAKEKMVFCNAASGIARRRISAAPLAINVRADIIFGNDKGWVRQATGDRQVGRLFALEDAVDVAGSARSIGDQAAISGEVARGVDRGARQPRSTPPDCARTKFDNNGGEGHPRPAPMRCGLRAGWHDGLERLCQETDESSTRCSKQHTS